MTDSITEAATRRLPPPGRLVRLWPRVRPYRWHLALASLALVASGLLALAFPMAVRYLLDAAFVERDRAMLDRIALALVVIFIVQSALNYFQTYLLSAVGERSVAGLRRELFARLLEMPPGFFAERRTGELTSRLTSDVGLLQGVLSHQVSEFARQILSLVGGVVLLTWLQPRLTLTALAVAPLVVGSAIFFGRRLRNITTGVQDRLAEATGVAEEAFSQIRTVQSFVQEPAERARFADRVSASVQAAIQRARIRGVFFGMLTLSTFGGRDLRAVAGRAAGAGRSAHRGRAGILPLIHDHDRCLDRRAGGQLQRLPGGGRRGGTGVRDPGDEAGDRRSARIRPR